MCHKPLGLHLISNSENQVCELVPAPQPGTTIVWEPFNLSLQNRESLFVIAEVLEKVVAGFPDFI